MKSTAEKINSVQHRVKVTIPSDQVNSAFIAAYQKLQKKAKVQGFRAGKAPLNIIKKLYGNNVSSEVREELISRNLGPAFQEEKLRPISMPSLEKVSNLTSDSEFEFSVIIDTLPTLSLENKYKNLEISYEFLSSNEQDIERELANISLNQAKKVAVEDSNTTIEKDMLINLKQSSQCEGKTVAQFTNENYSAVIGHKKIVPELETGLIGMKINEKKTITIQVEKDYPDQTIAGKELTMDVEIKEIHKLHIPKIDDELAKDLNCENLEKLKETIKKLLKTKQNNKMMQIVKKQFLQNYKTM